MTKKEKDRLAAHAGHNVVIADYMEGEPIRPSDGDGRFCLECTDCPAIILGDRAMIGSCDAISVK